ncbi:DnaB-like helicase C-terminal domain-containing protein [Paenibacillus illinoisensis]|uniref:DnaB-like helicase C-terminal domain-containing protein n=1 Tax=Paenibacillus illinoisensis TaxID=59845 RepID=UPI00301B1A8B
MPTLNEELQRKYDSIAHVGSERAVLSIGMRNPETLFDICTELEPESFSNFSNRCIYEIMLGVLDNKYSNISQVNPTVIGSIAQSSGIFDDIGGFHYLETLHRTEAGEENLKFFVGKVKQAAVRREAFMKAATVMDEAVENEDEDTDSFVARQEEKFLDIVMRSNGSDEIVHVGSLVDVVVEKRQNNVREILGMPSGFAEYDRQSGGYVPGRLKVVAATAKTGKSAHALNVAKNVAIHAGIPVLYIDTEMPTEEQIDRLISILATEITGTVVPESAVTKGLFKNNQAMSEAVDIAKDLIKNSPFYHVYMPDFTPEKVHNLARKFQRQHGVEWNGYENQFLLIFDYIKMPDESSKNANVNEYQVLGAITNMLKNKTAGLLNIPVLAYAQLNPRTAHGLSDVNSSHMSGSNRIVMYVNELSFLYKKTEDEVASDGRENGNLVWKMGESRNGGAYTGWIDYTIRQGVTRMIEVRNVSLAG